MAVVSLRVELELLQDIGGQMVRIATALRSRRGPKFAALEKRIETATATGQSPVMHELIGDVLIAAPPDEWTEILKEARRLSLI